LDEESISIVIIALLITTSEALLRDGVTVHDGPLLLSGSAQGIALLRDVVTVHDGPLLLSGSAQCDGVR
jgi:hypothetical protein